MKSMVKAESHESIQDWVLIRNLSNRCNFKSEQNTNDCPPGYCVNYKVSSEDVENLEKI